MIQRYPKPDSSLRSDHSNYVLQCPSEASYCILGQKDKTKATFYRVTIRNGQIAQHVKLFNTKDVPWYPWAVSPDGKQIALPLYKKISVYDVKRRQLTNEISSSENCIFHFVTWGNEALYATERCGSAHYLRQLDSKTFKRQQTLFSSAGNEWISYPVAQNKNVAFPIVNLDPEIWVFRR